MLPEELFRPRMSRFKRQINLASFIEQGCAEKRVVEEKSWIGEG